MSDFDDVGNFHHKFGLPSVTHEGPFPREVTKELMQFRVQFMLEELLEFCKANNITLRALVNGRTGELEHFSAEVKDGPVNEAESFDALLDLTYVVMGTAHIKGYPWQRGWDEVQAANMKKERAANDGSNSKRGSSWDVVKPANWRPPNIEGVLGLHGWVGVGVQNDSC